MVRNLATRHNARRKTGGAATGSLIGRCLAVLGMVAAFAGVPLAMAPDPALAADVVAGFNSVTLVANPSNWTITGLTNTINGSVAGGDFARIFTGPVNNATGVVIDYKYTVPRNAVTKLQLHNNGGSNLSDADGMGSALYEVFDPANNLLASGTLNAGNGAGVFVTAFSAPLDNVATVRLSTITNLLPGAGAAPDIIWREFQAVQHGIDIVKSSNPTDGARVRPGDVVTYTVTFANTDTIAHPNIDAADDLSGVLDDATLTGSPVVSPAGAGTASVTGSTLNVHADSIGPGQTVTVTYQVTVKPTAQLTDKVLGNVVTSPDSLNCPQPAGADPNCSTVHAVEAVVMDKTLQGPAVNNGDGTQTVVYDITVSNLGGATSVYNLTDTLTFGAGTTVTAASVVNTTPGGITTNPAWNGSTQTAVVTGQSIAVGVVHVYRVTVTATVAPTITAQQADCALDAGETGTGFRNTSALTVGSVTTTDDACTPVTVPVSSLSVVKSATPADQASFVVGQVVTYSFVVTNTGNQTLTNVTVDETGFSGSPSPTVSCPAGVASMAAGAQVTCTATYTVTQADVDNGAVTNTATASGTPPSGSAVTSTPSSFTVPVPAPAPALVVAKSVSPTSVPGAGETVTYSFTVTNTGNVTLTNVTVTETVFAGTGTAPVPSCPPAAASMLPGAQVVCTATYQVTQADVDSGSVQNSATASGTPPTGPAVTSPPGGATLTVPSTPSLAVEKSASPNSVTAVGQLVTYSFAVTNTGNVTLTGVIINEVTFGGTGPAPVVTCPPGPLAPGAQQVCSGTYTTTQADVDAGSISNTATASGTPPSGPAVTSDPSTLVLPVTRTPSIDLAKSVSPAGLSAAGQVVTYSFTVTNTGNVTLHDVGVSETGFTGTGTPPVVTCPAGAASVAPGAQVVCTATYQGTQADIDSGATIVNTATASGTPQGGPTVTSAPAGVALPVTARSAPALSVVKSATPLDPASFVVGAVLSYSFVVTNTGNVTMANVTVTETAFSGTGPAPVPACPAGAASMAPGDQVMCTATYTVVQADVDAGSITNTATASGTPPTGPAVTSPPSSLTVPAPAKPAITMAKSVDPTGVVGAGRAVTYSFLVTNTGNVTLTNVAIDESAFTGTGPDPVVTCPPGPLPPGARVTCTGTYTTTQADVDAGSVDNTASASAVPPSGSPVLSQPSSSTLTVTAPPAPSLSVLKSASPLAPSSFVLGQVLTYSFVVTNTGNVTLTNVVVADTAFSGTGPAPVVSCPPAAATMAAGAQVTCTATYTVTQADVDAGSITNTATATGTPPTGPPVTSTPSNLTVPALSSPSLSVVKSVSPDGVTGAGQVVTYSFHVTNTGNVTLTNVVVNELSFTGTGPAPVVTCPPGALLPGQQVTCSGTYTTTQGDVDAGTVTNTATGSGTPPSGPPVTSQPSTSTLTVTPTPAPSLSVVKSASPLAPASFIVGGVITYSFVVTNTGNVPLINVGVAETGFSGSGTAPVVTCPSAASSVAPGIQVTCTAAYAITQADVNAGSLTNTATATGTPPTGPAVTSPPSSLTVPAPANPALTMVKSVTPASVTAAGRMVTYAFRITNTGNVTLTNVVVNETIFTGTGTPPVVTCPAAVASMLPGAVVVCNATYTTTQADVDAGTVQNAATASGTPPTGPAILSAPSSVGLPITRAPAVTLVKTATPNPVTAAGQTVTYSFTVTNTGNVTLTNPIVHETAFTGTGTAPVATCPPGTVAPGAQVVCTATYTTTQADIDAGTVGNTATASATPPGGGTPVTSAPSTLALTVDVASKLGLAKTAHAVDVNGDGRIGAGDRVEWTLRITNQGGTTLADIQVADPTAGPVTCPAGSLAPGASTTCTVAAHVVTAADADAGTVTNAATATATDPHGRTVHSDPARSSVGVGRGVVPAPVLLAVTGIQRIQQLTGLAGTMVLLGTMLLLATRRRGGTT
ncbi:hypothetical protein Lfu02_72650 [Longispora fulva]|uniref:Putative repeat protein (TIGR01451 family) n=1 Tax=Longispora fulva TaxID=619741 RepID=A0A8J7GDS3_9ACTN|nr:DUF11 domain-containing protein [Longispora fulva]MBG6133853.1 putative repeat protein (TIGR01451 family) [Longispora fulva]GIG62893.1 hypothetical protein Lfu02_72650 [Longispora fulva]